MNESYCNLIEFFDRSTKFLHDLRSFDKCNYSKILGNNKRISVTKEIFNEVIYYFIWKRCFSILV